MKTFILFASLFLGTTSFAGPGHGHAHGAPAVSQKELQSKGLYHIDRLIKAGKLDSSWKVSRFVSSEKKKFSGHTEWVVTFENAKSVKGKNLYLFFRMSGEFVAANFTGK